MNNDNGQQRDLLYFCDKVAQASMSADMLEGCAVVINNSLGLGLLMLVLSFLTSCMVIEPASPGNVENPDLSGSLLIENITVIDAENGQRDDVDVLISQNRIIDVGKNISAAATRKIDGTGKFLIPGLWDAHVHLAYETGVDYQTFFPLSLAHGITYLRDTGGHLDRLATARKEAAENPLTPDYYVSGPLIDGEQRVYDGNGRADLSVGVVTAEQGAAMVDRLADQGVDFIKAYEMLTPVAFAGVVKRAKERGLPVTAHVPLSMRARQAARSGIADMQHLRNLEMDCVADGDELLDARVRILSKNAAPNGGALRSSIHKAQRSNAIRDADAKACDELIAILSANKVSQTPTLVVSRFFSRALFADPQWRKSYDLMPAQTASIWKERSRSLIGRKPTADDMLFDRWLLSMVKKLHEGGVPIMAGTDAPIGFLTPGISLHEELAMLVEAGLPPLEALRAATVTPASFFGLEKQQGLIAPGMQADLVLLDANPLHDIRNTMRIEAVIRKGRYLDRTELDALKSGPASVQ